MMVHSMVLIPHYPFNWVTLPLDHWQTSGGPGDAFLHSPHQNTSEIIASCSKMIEYIAWFYFKQLVHRYPGTITIFSWVFKLFTFCCRHVQQSLLLLPEQSWWSRKTVFHCRCWLENWLCDVRSLDKTWHSSPAQSWRIKQLNIVVDIKCFL